MKLNVFYCFLALALSHFVTVQTCFATEDEKTGQKSDSDPVAQMPKPGLLPNALLSLNAQSKPFSRYAFLVDKKARTLTVWEHDNGKLKAIGAWPADIGRREGDKVVEGDERTPEGIYFFQTTMDGKKVDFSQYGVRIFTMDYPNYFDRLERKTGSGIWLHAIPDSKSLLRGSRGCVVVRNDVIERLAQFIDLKYTPIVVTAEVEYLPESAWSAQQSALKQWLEGWRSSWEAKDIDKYISYYSDRFQSGGMNKRQWRRFKEALNKRYQSIEVGLKDVQIFIQGPKAVLRFLQNYKSDRREDFGAKTIYALKNGQGYEIIGESWQGL